SLSAARLVFHKDQRRSSVVGRRSIRFSYLPPATRTMRTAILTAVFVASASAAAAQAPKHPLTVEEFLALERVTEPAISPDAKTVAYTVVTTDLAANRRKQDLWLVPVAGGTSRRITDDALGGRSAK